MDFLRFSSSERYVSQVPLSKLSFEVTVERASIVEENVREVLCQAEVPWDAKEYSPRERIDMYKKVSAALRDFSTQHRGALLAGHEYSGIGPARTASIGGGNPSFTALENTVSRLIGSASNSPRASGVGAALWSAAGAAGDVPTEEGDAEGACGLPSVQTLVARLQTSQSSFFTRPTSEDFIDPTEEDIPVDPPQRFSRLAPLVLRQHRKEHSPNQRMYLMWATGHVPHRAHLTTATAAAPTAANPDATPRGGLSAADQTAASAAAGELHASESVVGDVRHDTSQSAESLEWIGEERVMCTLTCERDPHYLLAKPSLFDAHTLMVDSTHIYQFRVVPKLAEPAKRATPAAPVSSATAPVPTRAGHSPVASAFDLHAERYLSLSAEEGVQRLQRRQHAERDNAQRLLEAAVQQVPGCGVSATTTGLASHHVVRSPRGETAKQSRAPAAGEGPFTGPRRSSLPAVTQFHVFGTVERTLHVPYDTVYVRCELFPTPHLDVAASSGVGRSDSAIPSGAGTTRFAGPSDPQRPAPQTAPESCVFQSQMAHASRVMYDECLCAVDHVLNLPFECTYADHALPAKPLRMSLTVFTEGTGAVGHQAPVAYANAQLPVATPGRHLLEVPMWAPHKSGKEFVKSAFVGGAPALVDARQTGPPENGTGIGVKQGLVTDNVGMIRITVNILHQRRPLSDTQ